MCRQIKIAVSEDQLKEHGDKIASKVFFEQQAFFYFLTRCGGKQADGVVQSQG